MWRCLAWAVLALLFPLGLPAPSLSQSPAPAPDAQVQEFRAAATVQFGEPLFLYSWTDAEVDSTTAEEFLGTMLVPDPGDGQYEPLDEQEFIQAYMLYVSIFIWGD
jgi:hypothetical protein